MWGDGEEAGQKSKSLLTAMNGRVDTEHKQARDPVLLRKQILGNSPVGNVSQDHTRPTSVPVDLFSLFRSHTTARL